MVRGYIFDYGGTLDTRGDHWGKVLWHAYERCGVPVSEGDFRSAYVFAERFLAANKVIMSETTFRETLETKLKLQLQWLRENGCKVSPTEYKGIVLDDVYGMVRHTTARSVAVLEKLAEKYPLVLVSNFYGNVGTVLREFGFSHLFKSVVESAVVGYRKPDPRIFMAGVEKLGFAAAETMVVGDSYGKDILPASSIGCKTTWIKGEGWTDEEPQKPVADIIIHDLSELL